MIRPARPEDAEAIAAVIAASITGLCGADHHDDPAILTPWLASKNPEAIAEMLTDPQTRLLVAGRETILAVGGLSWAGQPEGQARITLVFVAPEARRQGLSSALLTAMEGELLCMGRPEVRLTATATAFAFYRHHGWHADGPPRQGRWIVGHPMVKRLN